MIYEFRCATCGTVHEEERRMADAGNAGPTCCGQSSVRLYTSNTIVDEIRGVNYWHPDKKMEVRGHGKYFDIGMGKWIESKSQKAAELKKRGWMEHGSKQV